VHASCRWLRRLPSERLDRDCWNSVRAARRGRFFAEEWIQYLAMDYLLKTEPTVYSFANLEKEKNTIWDGVTNPVAVKNLRAMKAGDRLVIYHTGDEKSAVGTASVEAVDVADPKTPQVKIKVGKAIARPKTLAEIKGLKLFA